MYMLQTVFNVTFFLKSCWRGCVHSIRVFLKLKYGNKTALGRSKLNRVLCPAYVFKGLLNSFYGYSSLFSCDCIHWNPSFLTIFFSWLKSTSRNFFSLSNTIVFIIIPDQWPDYWSGSWFPDRSANPIAIFCSFSTARLVDYSHRNIIIDGLDFVHWEPLYKICYNIFKSKGLLNIKRLLLLCI